MKRLFCSLFLSFSLSCCLAAVVQAAELDLSTTGVLVKHATATRSLADKLHDQPSVLDYGAVCDTQVLRWTEVGIAAGSNTLSVPHGWFQAKDAGKLIVVAGAGARGENLSTKIGSVQSQSQITLVDPAQSSVASQKAYVAYGTDDAPAINAVLAGRSVPAWDLGELHLPHGVCGVGSTIVLPGQHDAGPFGHGQVSLQGEGRGVSWIVALAPMRAVIQEPAGEHNQANLFDLGLDGSGLADFGADIQGGHGGLHRGLYYNDNRIAGLHLGTIAVNPDGTLGNPRSWYTNVWEFMVQQSTITADTASVMPSGAPLFGILNSAGDSHFSDIVIAHVTVAGVRDTGSAHNFYNAVHAWGNPRYEFWIRGGVQFSNCEVDGAREAGVRVDGDGLVWMGGSMISMEKGQPRGFYFSTNSGHHTILGPTIQAIPSTAYVVTGPGAAISEAIIQIPGWSGTVSKQ